MGIDNFEAVLDALEATAEAATPSPLLDVLGAATLNPCSLGALVQRLVRSASDRTAAAASATMPAHATGQSHFGTALLRRQLLGPERLLNGHTAATIARRLAEVGATASGASEYDALLTSVLLRPDDASYLLPALVALLDDGRSTQDEARETYETASPTACAALGLLARGARLAPAIAVELLPSRRLLELIDATLAWRPASDGGSDGREAISPLLHLLRITLEHGKSGRTAFLALISRAPALALAGAAEALMDLLFIYPLPLVCAALAALLDDLRASSAYNWGVTSTLMHTIGAAAPRLARALHAELKRARPGLSTRSQPAVAAAGATGGEEYDYLLEMEEKLAEEEALSHALIAQLAEAAVFRCAPLVVACAEDAATPSSVRMAAVGALGRLDSVDEQHGDGHGADAPGNRRNGACDLAHRGVIHVTAKLSVCCTVNPHINHNGARFNHVTGDHSRFPSGHDNNVSMTCVPGEIARLRVANSHCGTSRLKQHCHWLSNDITCTDNYGYSAAQRDLLRLKYFHHTVWRAGCKEGCAGH